MRRVLAIAFFAASGTAMTFACDAFTEGDSPGANDAATSADAPTASDGGDDAPPFCKLPAVEVVAAPFDESETVPFFDPDMSGGCTLGFSGTEGLRAPGALVATCASADGGRAQIDREFPLRNATRARLSFATKVNSIGDPAADETYIGCTLQLMSTLPDGGERWIGLNFEVAAKQIRFDQDATSGGPQLAAITVKQFELGEWLHLRFDLFDLTSENVTYRAVADGVVVPLAKPTVPLQAPPTTLRVKCGIDRTITSAVVVVDDIFFVMCEAP